MADIEYLHQECEGVELVLSRGGKRDYPWHLHAGHWIFGAVFAGSATLETRESARKIGPGDSFCIAPGEAHRLAVNHGCESAVLCVDGEKLPADASDMHAALRHGVDTLARFAGGRRALEQFIRLLASLPASSGPRRERSDRGHRLDPLRAAANWMRANPSEAYSISAMAAAAGYSRWHFIRAFTKAVGMTPHAFLLSCRVGRARLLLRKNRAAIEAALSAGFSDQSHMHRVFRLHHGLTPRQFLRASVSLERR